MTLVMDSIFYPLDQLYSETLRSQIVNHDEVFLKLLAILEMYVEQKQSSEGFKYLFLSVFNRVCDGIISSVNVREQRKDWIKDRILSMKDIVWLIPNMQTYSSIFVFVKADLDKVASNLPTYYRIKKILHLDGEQQYYDDDGTLVMKAFHHKGVCEGLCTFYTKDGQVKSVAMYEGGRMKEIKSYA